MACFRVPGKTASLNEAGALLTILVISSDVTTSKADILIQGRSAITGGGTPAVAWRILSTLERKNSAKYSEPLVLS